MKRDGLKVEWRPLIGPDQTRYSPLIGGNSPCHNNTVPGKLNWPDSSHCVPFTELLWHDNWPMQRKNPRALGGIFYFRSVLTTKESCRLEGPTLTAGGQTSGENDRQLETEAELCWDLSSHQGQID